MVVWQRIGQWVCSPFSFLMYSRFCQVDQPGRKRHRLRRRRRWCSAQLATYRTAARRFV